MAKGAIKCLQLYQKSHRPLCMLFTPQTGYTCSEGHAYLDSGKVLIIVSWLQLGL